MVLTSLCIYLRHTTRLPLNTMLTNCWNERKRKWEKTSPFSLVRVRFEDLGAHDVEAMGNEATGHQRQQTGYDVNNGADDEKYLVTYIPVCEEDSKTVLYEHQFLKDGILNLVMCSCSKATAHFFVLFVWCPWQPCQFILSSVLC